MRDIVETHQRLRELATKRISRAMSSAEPVCEGQLARDLRDLQVARSIQPCLALMVFWNSIFKLWRIVAQISLLMCLLKLGLIVPKKKTYSYTETDFVMECPFPPF